MIRFPKPTRPIVRAALAVILLAAAAADGWAQDGDGRAPAAQTEGARQGDAVDGGGEGAAGNRRLAGSLIQFRPPTRGAPTRRVGASTRSGGGLAQLVVIAPRTVAYTADPAPILYWHVGETDLPAVVTVVVADRIDPVIEIPVGVPAAGLHATPLAGHGVRLRAGVDHEWSVALVADPRARSRDIVASARFVHKPGGPDVPVDAGRLARLRALADGGYWYDLMRALLGADAQPEQPEIYANLLRDVGLADVAP